MKLGSAQNNHLTDLMFTLALLCVFAISAMLVVLVGANVYKKTVSQMDRNFSQRTSLGYVAAKIRRNDSRGAIHLEPLEGVTALVLDQEIDGQMYQTWIYHHNGSLREHFTAKDAPMDLESGGAILEVAEFHFNLDPERGLLLTTVDQEGRQSSQWVTPRCGLDAVAAP